MTLLFFMLASFIGGSNAAVVKFSVNQFPPILFVALRSLIALIVVLPFVLKTVHLSFDKKLSSLFLVNLIFAINWLTFAVGVQKTSVIMSQLIYVPTSLVVAIVSFFILGEKFKRNELVGLILTIGGVLILIISSAVEKSVTFGTLTGNLMVTFGMFCWVFYLVYSSKISKVYSPLTIIFYNFVISFIVASFLILLDPVSKNFSFFAVGENGFLGIVYVAVFSSAVYFYLNQWLIKHTSAFISSLQIYPITLIASMLGIIFYNEKLTISIIVAALMIMMGVFISTSYNYIRDKIIKF